MGQVGILHMVLFARFRTSERWMDAGCCRLLLLDQITPGPHVQGQEYFYACARYPWKYDVKCCQPQLAVDIEYRI